MINEIKQVIAQKILELYPSARIYDEDIPQGFKTPSFLVTLIEQDYSKRLANKYNSKVSFDVAYFSDKWKNEIKSDCQMVMVNLLRAFDLLDTFRARNLQANVVDNVLHITFDVQYSELREEPFIPMLTQTTKTNL